MISDRYKIVELMAMGGMGAIYKGEHVLMRKRVAIKVLHPDIEDFPELVARFEREAIAGAHVNHPNVAAASDFGKFDGDSYFLVLEYIEGATLSDLMADGPMDALRAVKLVRQLAAALGAAHSRGIVHRDMKPKNIMICEPSILETSARGGDEEIVKLIDFGLAKVPVEKLSDVARDPVADGKELTNAGVVMGTVSYMAPETAYGMAAVSARSDFYSLGIIFYQLLTGKHPFDETEPQKIFAAHCTLPPPPIAVRNPDVKVPSDLEAIVMRMLEKDPDKRHPDAESLIAALDAFKMRVNMTGTLSLRQPQIAKPPTAFDPAGPSSSGAVGLYVPKGLPTKSSGNAKIFIGAGVAVGAIAAIALFVALRKPDGEIASANSATSAAASVEAPAKTPEKPAPSVHASAAPTAIATATAAAPAAVDPAFAPDAAPESAAKALSDLLDAAPDKLAAPAQRHAAALALGRIADAKRPEADPLFERLATKSGAVGIELLYDLAAESETAPSSLKARLLIGRGDVYAQATPAMKIAIDLRRNTCERRPALLGRAATDGDDRALATLEGMAAAGCSPSPTVCCLPNNAELEKAVAAIKARAPR